MEEEKKNNELPVDEPVQEDPPIRTGGGTGTEK